jgi:hypothetical protein
MDLLTHPARPAAGSRAFGRLVAGIIVSLIAIVGLGSTASAGGWAVSTLDSTPTPVPGQPVEVGFTIRQHGVTPVDIDHGVGITIVASDGTVQTFPATRSGAAGHYVATVVFPAAGDYTWSVQQGGFADQDLGRLTVPDAKNPISPASPATDHRFPAIVRYGLPALAALFAAAAIADLIVGRRRRRTVVA